MWYNISITFRNTRITVVVFFFTLITTFDLLRGGLIEDIVSAHKDAMMQIAYRYTQNKQDAEDVVQNTFIKIYRHINNFSGKKHEEIRPLIVIYTKRTAIDFLRKRSRQVPQIPLAYINTDGEETELELEDQDMVLDDIVLKKEAYQILGKGIDALSEEERHLIQLKYRYRMTNKEIAAVLHIAESTVSTRLKKVKETLKIYMEETYHG